MLLILAGLACTQTTLPATDPAPPSGARFGDRALFHDGGWLVSAPNDEQGGTLWQVGPTPGSGPLSDASPHFEAPEPGDVDGAIATCGDWDGDGVLDLLLGGDPVRRTSGSLLLPQGLATSVDAVVHLPGTDEVDAMGDALGCGRLTGDGLDTIVVAAPDTDGFGEALDAGMLRLFTPTEAGGATTAATFTTTFSASHLGAAGALVADEDIDGDGVDDILVGATGIARVFGLPGPLTGALDNNHIGGHWFDDDGSDLGAAVVAGDFDGDGYVDLVASSPSAEGRSGAVHILAGPLDPIAGGRISDLAVTLTGAHLDDAGAALARLVDRSGDGLPDLLIGSPGANEGLGRVSVVEGPFGASPISVAAVAQVDGEEAEVGLGTVLAADASGGFAVGTPDRSSAGVSSTGGLWWFGADLEGNSPLSSATGAVLP